MVNKNVENIYSMRWFNFWKYFRFPLSIILSIANFFSIFWIKNLNFTGISIFILIFEILCFMYMCITFASLYTRKQFAYKILIIYLLVELFYTPFITMFNNYVSYFELPNITQLITEYVLTLTIWGVIWILPNYIYFKKRKSYFYEENSFTFKKEKIAIENTNISKEPIIEAKSNTIEKHRCKSNTVFTLTLILITETIILIIFGFLIWDIKGKLTNEQIQKKSLQSEIHNIEFYKKDYWKNIDKVSFMDEYVVIVPADTNIYHKYDCKYLDLSSFLVFNIDNAKSEGFKACKHCIK